MKFAFVELMKCLDLFAVEIPDDQAVVFKNGSFAFLSEAVIPAKMTIQRHVS